MVRKEEERLLTGYHAYIEKMEQAKAKVEHSSEPMDSATLSPDSNAARNSVSAEAIDSVASVKAPSSVGEAQADASSTAESLDATQSIPSVEDASTASKDGCDEDCSRGSIEAHQNAT
ncbi:unnamed protein product [Soboliphyme baturini]|uniref:GOLGA2L5 domain-containing protein n=1 Tax=Soboliphyme baturini TaxID=241478 RepID=A0A183J338_9BILA|nr:unnamed protein product [Soboliphyme baturini]